MTAEFVPGTRYRMPAVFGPALGPRQKADGTPWTAAESGTMSATWLTVDFLSSTTSLERLLPPGYSLRGEPVVSAQLAYFNDLYWIAGRGYGIAVVDFPVTYEGKTETIDGTFCPVMWEGLPDAIMTGREELGFPKLFSDIEPLRIDERAGSAGGSASWFGHTFFELEVHDLAEVAGEKSMPGGGGAPLYYKYMPRTSILGKEGADSAYVTTSLASPGSPASSSPIDFSAFDFRTWRGEGSVTWNRATFEQLPTTFPIINTLADLDLLEYRGAQMLQFSGPGIGVAVNTMRAVEPK